MLEQISSTIQSVINVTWPIVVISSIIMISFRISYLVTHHEKIVLYKELWMLIFGIYILCLFQVVTFQDDTSWATNNFIPFKEIMRYHITSRLFFENVLGNMIMFFPFGLFISYYLKVEEMKQPLFLTCVASVAIEIVQLTIGRVFDVDDILLNILGGITGYLLYKLLHKISEKLPSFCQKEWFLNTLSLFILIGLIGGIIILI